MKQGTSRSETEIIDAIEKLQLDNKVVKKKSKVIVKHCPMNVSIIEHFNSGYPELGSA